MKIRSLLLLALFPAITTSPGMDQGDQVRAPEGAIRVTHQARALQPGEVVLMKAESARPLSRLKVAAFGRDFPLYTEDAGRGWTGLVGIDLDTAPGKHTVRLRGTETGGKEVALEHPLTITAKKFPTRQLTVDDKFVSPPKEVLARIKKESERVSAIFASTSPLKFWRGAFIPPVPGPVISAFGKRSVYNGQPRSPHSGTDFRGAAGTPIRAPNAGHVILAAELYYSGNTVILDHGQGLYSYFGHMSAISVREGDQVEKGDTVGKVGATGLVTGPHLHWSVRLVGTRVDPVSLMDLLSPPKKSP